MYRSKAGNIIAFYICPTVQGDFCAGMTDDKLFTLFWPGHFTKGHCICDKRHSLIERLSDDLNDYFNGGQPDWRSYPIFLEPGTDFQQKVWRAMMEIPYGTTISYSELASRIGSRAYRAVGAACGANPLPILIPCHRVIRSDRGLGGYSSGLHLKKILFKCEGISV